MALGPHMLLTKAYMYAGLHVCGAECCPASFGLKLLVPCTTTVVSCTTIV